MSICNPGLYIVVLGLEAKRGKVSSLISMADISNEVFYNFLPLSASPDGTMINLFGRGLR
jgi:hypothetical protein